ATEHLLLTASVMLPPGWSENQGILCSFTTLLSSVERCATVRSCTFYWSVISLLFGAGPREVMRDEIESSEVEPRFQEWNLWMVNWTSRVQAMRSSELHRHMRKFSLFGHSNGPALSEVDEASTLLLYADSPEHLLNPDVSFFVNQLECYARSVGMQFVADSTGPRVRHDHSVGLDVSIEGEFFFSARESDKAVTQEVRKLMQGIIYDGHLETAGEIVKYENVLAVNYARALHFGRVWAMADQLPKMPEGALLIYMDSDVTLWPGSSSQGIAQRLLSLYPGPNKPHVFVADTWVGTDCANSGFVAVRNTPLGRSFLELWKEKLWWGASWDQAALAETLLEFVGFEARKTSYGRRFYDHVCMRFLVPYQKVYMFTKYCDCWQAKLDAMIGPYRRRAGQVVGFVDPEILEVNYIPNNLFSSHQWDLQSMHLAPR
ncbi:unnamed protein product, partial [Polarella glacialis]